MSDNKTNLSKKIEDLDAQVEWFYSDEFKLEDAIDKYEAASSLAKDIEKDLNDLKNRIEIIKEKFDK